MRRTKSQPLSITHSEIASQWSDRNENLKPDDVASNSIRSVYWQCLVYNTHQWRMIVRNFVRNRECPYCKARRQEERTNLAELDPEVAALWHPTRNRKLTPQDVSSNSTREVYWQCSSAHAWRAQVAVVTRAVREGRSGNGCPKCNNAPKRWNTTLVESFPQIARQWHKKLNGTLTAEKVSPGSNKVVFWKCPVRRTHVYEMSVARRVAGQGCPFCANIRVLPGENSLAAKNPYLASQWHHELNKDFTPESFPEGSSAAVFWQCPLEEDHVWKAQIYTRSVMRTGCPFCAGQRVSKTNCLAAFAPEIAKEWHPTKNEGLTAYDVTRGSDKHAFWLCQNNSSHEWLAQVYKRTEGRERCPFCFPRRNSSKKKAYSAAFAGGDTV